MTPLFSVSPAAESPLATFFLQGMLLLCPDLSCPKSKDRAKKEEQVPRAIARKTCHFDPVLRFFSYFSVNFVECTEFG